ncbi:hypothetical protein KKA69_04015 [Patescibacteria group bacterium]|nr:hypothetical protein [Patescibacteria group bacterium]
MNNSEQSRYFIGTIFAFFLPSFSGGCPQVSKKADLTRFPRSTSTSLSVKRARKALPPNGFLLLTGWPFTENVELHLISSAFGLAMLQRGAFTLSLPNVPTRRASETVGSNNPDEIGVKRKNAKILKNFLLT